VADPVWALVMFDLPVITKEQRRRAAGYRRLLLDSGFSMIQLSVYSKYLVNATGLRSLLPGIRANIPPGGAVRLIRLTDEQWAATYRYFGPGELPMEPKPEQLGLAIDLDQL
jgi:CRISPR-associated protein Cas2